MFGVNYVCVYLAEQHIPSGLMAVIFSLLAVLNLLGSLAFLALFGSVLAFGAYLTLVGRIGAGRAAA